MLAMALIASGCASDPNGVETAEAPGRPTARAVILSESSVLSERLDAFEDLRAEFAARNPGYGLAWNPKLELDSADEATRVHFVQGGACAATVTSTEERSSDLRVGDIVVLRAGESLRCDAPIASLRFEIPTPPPDAVPTFVRPDFDPLITDKPGGCAEEEDAYRRILLTWQGKVGPYLYHAINAHRVRILDSFTHYHPAEGGFDEFYLVQEAPEGAELIVSEHLDAIQGIAAVTRDDIPELLRRIPLSAGDLVYLPRTVVHRGLGGAVVQVITVPGFIPGAEIGVDAELARLNQRLGLVAPEALPVHGTPAAPR
ncbi:hypothetical protein Poly30_52010 [Planctomycetes bacterium Poly30]|uniref:Mannose-6-phosphate isomerase n=2 Tax=Saltatorellus ferox TaxID=2528018 RepID=A0A518EZY0_9BACT|nr:hypothetical protein Poly30_52010 [Planctomycetes bacterium Poly30]